MILFEKNDTLYAGRTPVWQNVVHLRPFLSKIDGFEDLRPLNFNLPIFCTEVLTPSGEPIILRLDMMFFLGIASKFCIHLVLVQKAWDRKYL